MTAEQGSFDRQGCEGQQSYVVYWFKGIKRGAYHERQVKEQEEVRLYRMNQGSYVGLVGGWLAAM